MTLLTAEVFFGLAGLILLVVAVRIGADTTQPKRIGTAAFWALLAATFLLGKRVPAEAIGACVVVMVLLAATKQVALPAHRDDDRAARAASAERLGHRLMWPTVLIPVVVIAGGFTLGHVRWPGFALVDAKQVTQVALGLGCLAGLIAALRVTRARPAAAFDEGGRLLQAIGWALILPQMLAALGGIFAKAGVGDVVAQVVAAALPTHQPFVAVVAYCAGMTLFTIVMGNAFAAFPVITLGIGLPFIVKLHGGNPAIMGALGMLSGYCGTLVTPMAANFNLVPAMLLELDDRHAVIKAQVPFAVLMWLFNVVVMYLCVYRF